MNELHQISATNCVVFQVLLLSTMSIFQALVKITRLFCFTLPGDTNKNQRQIIVGIMRSWTLFISTKCTFHKTDMGPDNLNAKVIFWINNKGWANDPLMAGSKIEHGATVTVWSPARTLLLTSHYRTGERQGQFSVDSPWKTLFDLLKLSLCLQPKSDLKSRKNFEIGQY